MTASSHTTGEAAWLAPVAATAMSVWSHRPAFSHWALFTAAFVLGCGFAKALAIVPGSSVSFWPPGGLLMATLMLTPVPSWPWWILGGALAESFGQLVWFSSGLPIGFLIIAGNALEAMAGAWLVNRVCGRTVRLETLQEVIVFVVLGAVLAPVISATVGSATLWWFGIRSQAFWANWPLWWIGDATGILLVAPLTLIAIQNWRGMAQLTAARWIELSIVGAIFLGVTALSLGGHLPFAYIVMPPLLWAAVRFDFRGAAVTLILLALITAVFALSGIGQFAGDPESQRQKQIMLHLFLAVSALSALIVAALSRQHQQVLLTLRESERQLQQMVDAVPVRIWRTTPAGSPVYFNKRYQDYLRSVIPNFDDLEEPSLDHLVQELIHPEDAAGVRRTLGRCFETGDGAAMRFRWREKDGAYRWAECRVEPRRDENGVVAQWYGASIDIDDEVRAQAALRDRERRLQQLVDAVPAMIWSATGEGSPAFVNKRFTDVTGTTIEDNTGPEGSRALTVIHPDDRGAAAQTIADCFKAGTPVSMRFRQLRRDGSYRWTETRAEPLRDESGTILQWYGVSTDIHDMVTAQNALLARERELQQLIDAVPVMIWSTSPEGRPSYVNKRFTDVTAATLEDITAPDGSFNLSVIHPEDRAATVETLRRSLRVGIPYVIQYRQLRRDGGYRWTETRAEALRDESGAVLQWYGVSVDIDDQVRLYSELEEREARIRRLVDSDVIGIVFWDLDGTLIDANDAFLRMVQYDREELKAGLDWFAMTPPDWQEVHAREEAAELATTGRMLPREKEYFRKDGSRVPVLIGAACFDGQPTRGVAYILDLTETKRTAAALRDRERELQQLVDAVPAMVWSTTAQGATSYLNKRFTDVTGAVLGDLFAPDGSAAPLSVCHPDDLAASTEVRDRAFAAGTPYVLHYRQIRRDGSYRWTETRGEPLRNEAGDIIQWYGVSVDIHDMVTAQQALRDQERELSQLVNMVPVHIRRLTPEGEPTFFNKRLLDFYGFADVSELDREGMSRFVTAMQTLIHPDDLANLVRTAGRSFASGEPFSMKYRTRRSDGAYRWMDTRAEPLRNQSGAIVQWYVISLDIDDEVRAQEALRERERELSQLVNMVPVYIRRLTPEGEPIFFNKRLTDFIGVNLADIGTPGIDRLAPAVEDFVHPDEAARLLAAVRHAVATGVGYAMKYRMRRADGVYRWIETRSEPVLNEDGTIAQWYVVSIDVDDEVRAQQAEESLRQASAKLAQSTQAASLAELSASIAHEVNQPLAAIVANSHACQRWLSAEPANVERAKITVERIIRDANSAADVVGRIRALFRQSVKSRDGAKLPSVVAEAYDLMADEASRQRVRIDIEVESDLPPVAFDRVQIQQVLVNLIRNGMDAMDAAADNRVVGIRVRRADDAIRTEISDRGRGVAFPDRIFEPFFTTKENGMGMGLAICRSIIESHGGRLWAEKNEPQGARFVFTLPLDPKAAHS